MAKVERRAITLRAVEAMQPGNTLWDGIVKGLCLAYRGGGKQYLLKTRINGRQRWLTLGTHGGSLTPELARASAKRMLGAIADGKDPATARDASKAALTVAETMVRFLDDHVASECKPSTFESYVRLDRLYVTPALGRIRIDALSDSDVAAFHKKLRAKKATANRTLAIVSRMCAWAEQQRLRARGSNPCRGISLFKTTKGQRFLSEAELAKLGDALNAAEPKDGPHVIGLIRLLILTGARRDEIRTLRWQHVDLERGLLLLPDSKSGAKAITLNAPAAAILASLPRLEGNPFVIAGLKPGAPFVGVANVWQRVRKAADLEDVRLHDLRHSFASVAAARGGSLPLIGKLLGHTQASTTQRYAHLGQSPVSDLAEAVGRSIAASLDRNRAAVPTAEIVPIKRGVS